MHRIDTDGAVSGLFQAGNPATGQRATMVDADWLNSVQETIAHVIEGAGLDLAKGDYTLLTMAIEALVAGVVGTGGGAVPTTRQVASSGLLTGGGSLAADRTLTVAAASPAQTAAMVLNNVALTPLSLTGILGMTTGPDYAVLNHGSSRWQIVNGWAAASSTTIFTLPETYPIAGFSGWCNGDGGASGAASPYVNGIGQSTVSVFNGRSVPVAVSVLTLGR